MTFHVTVRELSAQFEVGQDETIVEAATARGVPFPYSCHSGTCGTCKSKLVSGQVSLLDYSKFTLTDEERDVGLILACCAIPQSDCEVSLVSQASPIPARRFSARVAGIRDATHDIKILQLQFPGSAPPRFLAGQYADLTIGQLPKRSYSMANIPGEPTLEFHIRNTKGSVSSAVHETLAHGDTVGFYGPLGSSYLRDDHHGPVIAVAGGSGLGPIKSIVDTMLSRKYDLPIHFYFGVRDERDLYFAEHFRGLARVHSNLQFTPVLSEPSAQSMYRTGYLADAIGADLSSFAGFKAYLAGPPIMVDTCLGVIQSHGLAAVHCHADAF